MTRSKPSTPTLSFPPSIISILLLLFLAAAPGATAAPTTAESCPAVQPDLPENFRGPRDGLTFDETVNFALARNEHGGYVWVRVLGELFKDALEVELPNDVVDVDATLVFDPSFPASISGGVALNTGTVPNAARNVARNATIPTTERWHNPHNAVNFDVKLRNRASNRKIKNAARRAARDSRWRRQLSTNVNRYVISGVGWRYKVLVPYR